MLKKVISFLFIVCLFLASILIMCASCDQNDPVSNVKDVLLSLDGTIRSYEETSDGLLIEFEEDWSRAEPVFFLITSETNMEQIWMKEKIESHELDLRVTILAYYQRTDLQNTYLAHYISSGPGLIPDDILTIEHSAANSYCTKIEKRSEGVTESFIVYSDGMEVNRLFTRVGLKSEQSGLNVDEWLYRITYHYNRSSDNEIVCYICADSIIIDDNVFNVKLKGGMQDFFAYWEPIYSQYHSLYGSD